MNNKIFKIIAVGFFLQLNNIANAALIYGSDASNTSGGPISVFNTETGTTQILANSLWNLGLAFDMSNNLFGINRNSLYSINTSTGITTFIGTASYAFSESAAFDMSGRLLTAADGGLHAIDTNTGASTLLGAFNGHSSFDGLTVARQGITTSAGFFAAGTLFAVDSGRLYTIDINTLNVTSLMSAPADETIAFGSDGTLYGNSSSSYWKLDLINGLHTNIGGGRHFGSAVLRPQVPVPSPTTISIFALGLVSLLASRKYKKQ